MADNELIAGRSSGGVSKSSGVQAPGGGGAPRRDGGSGRNGGSARSGEPSGDVEADAESDAVAVSEATGEPGEAPVAEATVTSRYAWRGRTAETLRLIRANPTGRVVLKVVVGLLGALVLAVGIFLIPLPGPGWAIVLLGLAIWAIEFAWARHLLQYTRRQLSRWTHWVARLPLWARLVAGLIGLAFVAAVVWASIWLSFGVNLLDKI